MVGKIFYDSLGQRWECICEPPHSHRILVENVKSREYNGRPRRAELWKSMLTSCMYGEQFLSEADWIAANSATHRRRQLAELVPTLNDEQVQKVLLFAGGFAK